MRRGYPAEIHEAMSAGANALDILKDMAKNGAPESEMGLLISVMDHREVVSFFNSILCSEIVETLGPLFGTDTNKQSWLLRQPWNHGNSTIGASCSDSAMAHVVYPFIIKDDLEKLKHILPKEKVGDIWTYASDPILRFRPVNEIGRWCIEQAIEHGRGHAVYCDAAEAGYVDIMKIVDKHENNFDDDYIRAIALRKACENGQTYAIRYLVEEKRTAENNPEVRTKELFMLCPDKATEICLLESLEKMSAPPFQSAAPALDNPW